MDNLSNTKSQNASKNNAERLLQAVRESCFKRTYYSVDITLAHLLSNLAMFIHGDMEDGESYLKENPDRIFDCVPAFQRDNNKWTQQMQIKFVENLILGYKTELMFYELADTDRMPLRINCKVLDGLQRLTALHAYITGEFNVMGVSWDEAMEMRLWRKLGTTLKLRVYTFTTEKEAVNFYINMNENITHSPEDIAKARRYLTLECQ